MVSVMMVNANPSLHPTKGQLVVPTGRSSEPGLVFPGQRPCLSTWKPRPEWHLLFALGQTWGSSETIHLSAKAGHQKGSNVQGSHPKRSPGGGCPFPPSLLFLPGPGEKGLHWRVRAERAWPLWNRESEGFEHHEHRDKNSSIAMATKAGKSPEDLVWVLPSPPPAFLCFLLLG